MHSGTPGHHFDDPEVPKDTQQDTLGTRHGLREALVQRRTLWLNAIVSKGRRVWEEGCEKSPEVRFFSGLRWNSGDFSGSSKSMAGAIL